MRRWFQNLNESGRRLFHFRGSIGPKDYRKTWLKYEACSGFVVRFEVSGAHYGDFSMSIGLLFVTLYLTFPTIRSWPSMAGRHYGFYFTEWELVAFFGAKVMSSSSTDPWWYRIRISLPNLLFGRTIHFEQDKVDTMGVGRRFEFRGKTYHMDSIEVKLGHWFRPRIPLALYDQKVMRMHLKISQPPMRAGKGENSWDCDDDGSYGLTCPYDGPEPTFANREEVFEYCCLIYCDNTAKSIRRYGRAGDDKAPADAFGFRYLGIPQMKAGGQ